jgi:hypothetical protein
MTLSSSRKRWILWISAGVLLRLIFIVFPRPQDDDSSVYLELGHNLLHRGIYGMADGDDLTPSLFRLPGYPIFLATIELLFAKIWPLAWHNVVYVVQAAADLTGGLLLASFARRFLSERAAEIALALAMLCPFTAVETGIGMTESLSIFGVSLGIYAAGRALAAAESGRRDLWALVLAGLACALSMIIRPDGALLPAALGLGLLGYTTRNYARNRQRPGSPFLDWPALRREILSATLFCAVAIAPLVPWTVRNWTDFHVFQPLAPRHVNDPGERVNLGFYRWMRTWSAEFLSTANVFWNVGSETIDIDDIPARAFDSPQQREQTRQLLDEYNQTKGISPELDARFAALAAQRIHSHPFSYCVWVPLLRVGDMLLRPRTEAFYLDIYWWSWSQRPVQTALSSLLGLINLGYVVLAAWGFLRGRVPWAWMLGAYLVMRFLLLGTMENSEPRYTLQCFPILIVAAAAALAPRLKAGNTPAAE